MALLSQDPLKVALYKAHVVERSGERAIIGPGEKYLDRGGWDVLLGSHISEIEYFENGRHWAP